MSIFENIFGKKEKLDNESDNQVSPSVATENVIATEEEKLNDTPKTLEDIKEAKSKIQDLKTAEYELLEKRKDAIKDLKNLGVVDTQTDSSKRSETFNEILNPIEDEIKKVAEELANIREEFDMPQNRIEILKERSFRLDKIADRNAEEFLNTEAGKILKKEIINIPQESRPENPQEILSWIKNLQFKTPDNPVADLAEYKQFAETNLRIQKLKEKCDEELMNLR